jgi:hypothetical protein
MTCKHIQKKMYFQSLVVVGVVTMLSTSHAEAAIIRATPSSAVFEVGTSIPVKIEIDGQGVPFNAAQATISVSQSLVVDSISVGNCNLSFVKSPTFQEPSFAGAILGGSSSLCTVYTMTVHALSPGAGTVLASNASVKSFEGSSEILSGVQNSSYTVVPRTNAVQPTASVISSPTPILSLPSSSPRAPLYQTTSNTLIPTPTTTPLPSYSVSLAVKTPDGNPVPNAQVALTPGNHIATTDDNGIAHFKNVEAGEHTAKAETEDGMALGATSVNVSGEKANIQFGMLAAKESKNSWGSAILIAFISIFGVGVAVYILWKDIISKKLLEGKGRVSVFFSPKPERTWLWQKKEESTP